MVKWYTEQNNAVLVNKLMLDKNNKYPVDVIVTGALNAKNALHTFYG